MLQSSDWGRVGQSVRGRLVIEEDFFARMPIEIEGRSEREDDATLAAMIHLYLRRECDAHDGRWKGRDEHDTLKRTCHAVEVLHRLNLDANTAAMVRSGGNWLINLPGYDLLPPAERTRAHLYPSRFKTLAYLRRFDDDLVRRDFAALLSKEVAGMIRGVTESDVLTTCIVLDTLLTLERQGLRTEVCGDDLYERILGALRQQFKSWRPAEAARGRPVPSVPIAPAAAVDAPATGARKRRVAGSEIDTPRDLSYVLGLLLQADRSSVSPRQLVAATSLLLRATTTLDRTDFLHALYAALQLAEHFHGDEVVSGAITHLLRELREAYATPSAPRRWDFLYHTLVLRLLLTHYGDENLSGRIVALYLASVERPRGVERDPLEVEMMPVIRDGIRVDFQHIHELSGGYTQDSVFRVTFQYWYPVSDQEERSHPAWQDHRPTSVVVKRGTSDTFRKSAENYHALPPSLRQYFVQQSVDSRIYKSGDSPAYYLTMEDLADLVTYEQLVNDFDHRAMSEAHERLLRFADSLICGTTFALFRETQTNQTDFPGPQAVRLYLAPIESKLNRAIASIPWLKNLVEGLTVGDLRYRGLEQYLLAVSRHMGELQPRALGLTHGDLHPRNVMLDRNCTRIKLIDLDKLSWMGDYVSDLGNLLADVCIFRRLATPEREFGLDHDLIEFSRNAENLQVDNILSYPMLGRSATALLQRHVLEQIAAFAADLDDRSWKPRLWLAAAAALITRLTFVAEKKVAAVLYAEAVRLLHELARYLDQGIALPAELVPEPRQVARTPVSGELPDWAAAHALLRALHEGLRQIGLRPVADRSGVSYHASAPASGVQMRLVQPSREGIARLLLASDAGALESSAGVRVVRSGQERDAFGTIVILEEQSPLAEVLRLARRCLEAVALRAR
ncbi:MAG: phosphotransferase family protein [Ktedonobacterales bacterium]